MANYLNKVCDRCGNLLSINEIGDFFCPNCIKIQVDSYSKYNQVKFISILRRWMKDTGKINNEK